MVRTDVKPIKDLCNLPSILRQGEANYRKSAISATNIVIQEGK